YFAGDLGIAFLRLRHPAILVVVAGDPATPATAALRAEAGRVGADWVIPLFIDSRRYPSIARAWGFPPGGAPAAILAAGRSARATASSPRELRQAALRMAGAIDSGSKRD